MAYLLRLSGLRQVMAFFSERLGTENFSTISHALARSSTLKYIRLLIDTLQSLHRPGKNALVILDGMAVSLPKTQRHRCKKMNNNTVGGGVVWAFAVDAAKGLCPVKILKVIEGAWHDSKVMEDVELIAKGPVYVMDRGFYAFHLIDKWLKKKVHFIVRARARSLYYHVEQIVSFPRRIGAIQILEDAIVLLGQSGAKDARSVRLIKAILSSGEELILTSDLTDWSAEALLDAYKKRWHIERFHRLLKDTMGLAHLYSFSQNGIAFLIHTALLLALLLYMSVSDYKSTTLDVLKKALRDVRIVAGCGTPWKRNSCSVSRGKKTKRKKKKNP